MQSILINRALSAVIVLWGAVTMVFIILRVVPGDPASLALGIQGTPQQIEALRHQWGLDQPLIVQYSIFLSDMVRGNFGESLNQSEPALKLIVDRIPATFQLAIPSLLIAVIIALPLGIISATHANSLIDRGISVITLGAQSMPNFWFGLMLILILARNWGVLPTSGSGTWQHMVLPVTTLTLPLLSILVRFVHAGMLENLRMDYVRTAQGKGLAWGTVLVRHVFKNMLIPFVTILGLQAGFLLGGVVVVEEVFAWPGMGRLTVDAILRRDYPIVQVGVLVIALIVVVVNLSVDLLYSVLDPKVRVS